MKSSKDLIIHHCISCGHGIFISQDNRCIYCYDAIISKINDAKPDAILYQFDKYEQYIKQLKA